MRKDSIGRFYKYYQFSSKQRTKIIKIQQGEKIKKENKDKKEKELRKRETASGIK